MGFSINFPINPHKNINSNVLTWLQKSRRTTLSLVPL